MKLEQSSDAIAGQVRALVDARAWSGTISKLAPLLSTPEMAQVPVARLAIWLRRNEPTLWWTYRISVRFTRTGRERLVHLARREPLTHRRLEVAASMTVADAPPAVT